LGKVLAETNLKHQ